MANKSGNKSGNKRCKKCTENEHDSTGDHLFLVKDGTKWICVHKEYHKDKRYYFEDLEEREVLADKIEVEDYKVALFEEVKTFRATDNKDRSISKETAEHYGVLTSYSEETRQPSATYYPMYSEKNLVAYKRRGLPKSFSVLSEKNMKGVDVQFFGQDVCNGGKKLLITGGEEDCLAAYQMLKERYPKFDPSVVSLPNGENLNCVSNNKDFLDKFDEVLICTDMDDAGRKVADDLCKVVGDRARIVTLEEKDASDMLVKDKQRDFVNAYFNAKGYRPSTIILIEDILEDIVKPVEWGLSYPFNSLTNMTYGMKKGGEIIGIASGPGAGKSTLMTAIQTHLIFEHKQKIALFDIEEPSVTTGKHLIGNIVNKPIHKPDCVYNQEEVRAAAKSVNGMVEIFDGHPEWDEVKDTIRYFASRGIMYHFLDPLSALVNHLSSSEANEVLGGVMDDLMRFRKELGLTFFHVNHLNNPSTGKDHGAGGKVYASQLSGSRAMWKFSTAIWGLQRNQLADTEDERNLNTLTILKDRLGGNTGDIALSYSKDTGKFTEVDYEF